MKAMLEKLIRREDLTIDEARDLMSAIMNGDLNESQIAGVLVALRTKGETVDEIAGFVDTMRAKALRVTPKRTGLVDTCGTGGDAQQNFNISTATALVAAGMDIPIAKHGNRALSSKCGSADVLEELGVSIVQAPEQVAELIDTVGIGFMFAPSHHPATKHAAPVRKGLGIRTVFNLLGPLTNPAFVKRQLVGVFHADLTEIVARVLHTLGSEKVFVVHGLDGSDEISVTANTKISALADGEVNTFEFSPASVGIELVSADDIAGGTPQENAVMISDILDGKPGARRDAVALNAAFVAMVADKASTVEEGLALARETIDSGRARDVLEKLRAATPQV